MRYNVPVKFCEQVKIFRLKKCGLSDFKIMKLTGVANYKIYNLVKDIYQLIDRNSLIQHILDGHKLDRIRRSHSCMIRSKQTPYYDNECEYGTKNRYYVFTKMDLESKIEVNPKHLTIKY